MTTAAYQANGRTVARGMFYEIACDPRRSVVVEACAGAGKTWMLVSRILRALLDGAAPHEILAITFTRKAAGEMRERLAEWLRAFDAHHASEAQRIGELVARGVPASDAAVLAPRLARLHEDVLRGGRHVQISTFHAWFAQLLRAAPLALLDELRLQPEVELIEDLADHRPEVLRRFHTAILRDPALRDDHATLIRTRGRSQAQAWLDVAWDKRTEFELADAAGVLETSVAAADGFAGHPADAALDRAGRARLGALVDVLLGGGKRARDAAEAVAAALSEPESAVCFERVWAALFTDKHKRRDLGAHALLDAAHAELEAFRAAIHQHDSRLEHLRMVRLTRVLLAELAAYKRERGLAEMADLERCGLALLRDATLAAWVQERLDARIRHLLVDEFQDTSPLQWHALHAWLAGYSGAGGGASGQRGLSVFIVGDPKQSIYRFRRAEPRVFEAAREFVVEALEGDVLECDHTRRNAPELLAVLNPVFTEAAHDGEFAGFRDHTTECAAQPGAGVFRLARAERPPRAARSAPSLVWRDSLTVPRRLPEEVLREREAAAVAEAIAALVAGGGAQPADIFVLSRKRESLRLVADALRHRALPFAAVEATALMDAPEARDLVALLDVLVSTTHRLALAQVLRSPLFGASDAELIALARRADERGGDWWAALVDAPRDAPRDALRDAPSDAADDSPSDSARDPWRDLALEDEADFGPALQRARDWLPRWRERARQLPPHDLLDRVVFEGEVRERVAATVPVVQRPAALAAIDALLAQALTLDGARYATPYNFVRALKRRALKAAAPPQTDAVQLLTVHGAKGLEADVVFVMDTEPQPQTGETTTLLVDWPVEAEAPRCCAFVYAESSCPPSLAGLLAAERAARRREELNGLYVAMTRARRCVVFSATPPTYPAPTRSWWERVEPLATPWEVPAAAPTEAAPGAGIAAATAPFTLRRIAPLPPRAEVQLPLALDADPGLDTDSDTDASRLGRAVHRVLEWATAATSATVGVAGDARAAAAEFGADPLETARLARRILESGDAARFFGGPALRWAGNEVPIAGPAAEVLRIDRLVCLDEVWWVLDYKLQHAPQALAVYREQLRRYRDAVRRLQPGAAVRCAFITGEGAVVEVD